jgi:hypothetical protein
MYYAKQFMKEKKKRSRAYKQNNSRTVTDYRYLFQFVRNLENRDRVKIPVSVLEIE